MASLPKAQVFTGPTLLQVGERSPKDKNYETAEVVLAPPGTVVAPIPKGMPRTEENGALLILEQIMRAFPSFPQKSTTTTKGVRGLKGAAIGGLTIGADPFGQLSTLASVANTLANYDIANRQLQFQRQQYREMFPFGAPIGGVSSSSDSPIAASYARQAADHQSRASVAAAEAQADAAARAAQLQYEAAMARIALDRMLGLRELDLNKMLGTRTLDLRQQEIANAFQLGQRELDIENAAREFQRIMAGVSEASLPGVRAGAVPGVAILPGVPPAFSNVYA